MDSSDVLSSCLVYFIIVPVYVTMFRWILATGVIACFDMSEQLCVSCWDKSQAMEKARTTEAVGGEKKQKVGMTSGDERKEKSELGNDVMPCAHANSGRPQNPLIQLPGAPLEPSTTIDNQVLSLLFFTYIFDQQPPFVFIPPNPQNNHVFTRDSSYPQTLYCSRVESIGGHAEIFEHYARQ